MSVEIEDVLSDPHKFGLPTLEEFKANPDKWRAAKNELLAAADDSSKTHLKNVIRKQYYEFNGYQFKNLEHVERAIADHGLEVSDCEMYPQVIPDGDKCDLVIEFRSKSGILESVTKGL